MNILIEKTYAATDKTLGSFFSNFNGADPKKDLTSILSLIKYVFSIALDFATILAVIMVLYGAFQYVTAYGDDSKAETGKKTIMWSIIGLFILASARIIVSLVAGEILANPKALLGF